MTRPRPTLSRRTLLRRAALAGLGGLAAWLGVKRLVLGDACPAAPACRPCPLFSGCPLPRARRAATGIR